MGLVLALPRPHRAHWVSLRSNDSVSNIPEKISIGRGVDPVIGVDMGFVLALPRRIELIGYL